MKRLLQINVDSAVCSIGKITEDISKVAQTEGWETHVAFTRDYAPSITHQHKLGSMVDVYLHYIQHRLFDAEGLGSKRATQQLLKIIDTITPDIIIIHDIHDHSFNYPLLFEHFKKIDTPIIWVQHDCWAFTGGCMYFDLWSCNKWQTQCYKCPNKRSYFCDKSTLQYNLKKKLFNDISNLTIVAVSNWLSKAVKQSFLKNNKLLTIHNGIDINRFKPTQPKSDQFTVMGCAMVWDQRKGLEDFFELRKMLPSDVKIVLVGLSNQQKKSLPEGIEGICKTHNVEELVDIYSSSNVFVNPTYSDNYPTTNLEAMACGTPVVTYNTGGSPEAITEETGIVVKQGDKQALAEAIQRIMINPMSSEACRRRAEDFFDKNKCFYEYISLFNSLLNK